MNHGRDISGSDIVITRATLSDAPTIAGLYGQLFEQAWSRTFIFDLINDPNCQTLIATDNRFQQCVAFTIVRVAVDEAEVLSLGVAKLYQGLGIGQRLVETVLTAMLEANVRSVFLEVAEDNAPACAVYRRHGFQQTGRRRNYYTRADGETCDALTLTVAPSSYRP